MYRSWEVFNTRYRSRVGFIDQAYRSRQAFSSEEAQISEARGRQGSTGIVGGRFFGAWGRWRRRRVRITARRGKIAQAGIVAPENRRNLSSLVSCQNQEQLSYKVSSSGRRKFRRRVGPEAQVSMTLGHDGPAKTIDGECIAPWKCIVDVRDSQSAEWRHFTAPETLGPNIATRIIATRGS